MGVLGLDVFLADQVSFSISGTPALAAIEALRSAIARAMLASLDEPVRFYGIVNAASPYGLASSQNADVLATPFVRPLI